MKEQLVQIINTYAAARVSNDSVLVEFATRQVSEFLSKVEVTEIKSVTPEVE